jgi:light-regulated signal transduction histidine kinase (bacteriophytochrome)
MTQFQNKADLKSALEKCARENLQTPDTIQPHGCVLSINNKSLKVESVSSNIEEFTDAPPNRYLEHRIDDILDAKNRHLVDNGIQEENAIKKTLELGPIEITVNDFIYQRALVDPTAY